MPPEQQQMLMNVLLSCRVGGPLPELPAPAPAEPGAAECCGVPAAQPEWATTVVQASRPASPVQQPGSGDVGWDLADAASEASLPLPPGTAVDPLQALRARRLEVRVCCGLECLNTVHMRVAWIDLKPPPPPPQLPSSRPQWWPGSSMQQQQQHPPHSPCSMDASCSPRKVHPSMHA